MQRPLSSGSSFRSQLELLSSEEKVTEATLHDQNFEEQKVFRVQKSAQRNPHECSAHPADCGQHEPLSSGGFATRTTLDSLGAKEAM